MEGCDLKKVKGYASLNLGHRSNHGRWRFNEM
jgi:hypothetical protein